jgi:hypothetical protein
METEIKNQARTPFLQVRFHLENAQWGLLFVTAGFLAACIAFLEWIVRN